MTKFILILTALSVSFSTLANDRKCESYKSDFKNWVSRSLTPRVIKELKNYNSATIKDSLSQIKFNCKILSSRRSQSEFTSPPWLYVDNLIKPENLEKAKSYRARFHSALSMVTDKYSVDSSVLLSFWGRESLFGEKMGDYSVLEAVAIRAFMQERSSDSSVNWFINVLATFRIAFDNKTHPMDLKGSWAGAFGHTQFIPTTYEWLAVDSNNDGLKKLWDKNDPSDALASTANFLKKHSWELGQKWALPVEVPAEFPFRKYFKQLKENQKNSSIKKQRKNWLKGSFINSLGLINLENNRPIQVSNHKEFLLVMPQGATGLALLASSNFYSVMRYNNNSIPYTLSVLAFSDEIAGRNNILQKNRWKKEIRQLTSPEVFLMQTLINHLGGQTGKPDGKIGPNTRFGIHNVQTQIHNGQGLWNRRTDLIDKVLDLPNDGYPYEELLFALAQAAPNKTNEILRQKTGLGFKLSQLYPLRFNYANRLLNYKERVHLQQALLHKGYNIGKADSILGNKTKTAIIEELNLNIAPEDFVILRSHYNQIKN